MGEEADIRRLRTLYQLLAALNHASTLEDVSTAAITSLLDGTTADRAAILLFDDDGALWFKSSRGLSDEYRTAVARHSPWPRGTLNAQPLVVPDVLLDQNFSRYRGALEREKIRGLVFVPLELDAGVGKSRPGGIGIDSRGNVWFADAQKHSLFRIDAAMVPKLWPKPGASHALPPDNRASKARRP
jgi:hypothetical protein